MRRFAPLVVAGCLPALALPPDALTAQRAERDAQRTVILAGLHEGRRLNSPNDLVLDTVGRIYFTDPRYVGDGSVSNPRILVDFRPDVGPDGMAVDVDGNLYTARPAAEPGVYVYSPAGEELAYLRLPEGPTNAAFGTGAHDRTLFVTAGPNVYAVPTRRAGYHPHPLPAR